MATVTTTARPQCTKEECTVSKRRECSTKYEYICFPKSSTSRRWDAPKRRRKRSVGFIRNFVDAKREFVRDVVGAKRQLWRQEKRIFRQFIGGLGGKKKKEKKKNRHSRPQRPSPPPPPTPCGHVSCASSISPPPPPPPSLPLPPSPPAPPPPPPAEPPRPSNDAAAAAGQSCVLAPKRKCEWVAYKTVCQQVEDDQCIRQQVSGGTKSKIDYSTDHFLKNITYNC